MENTNSENLNITVARDYSHKFEFYFIALVFTILGLSIQTSSITMEYYQCIFEFFAWFSLMISGLAGLSRLEWVPILYYQKGKAENEENSLNAIIPIYDKIGIVDEKGESKASEELAKSKNNLESRVIKRKNELGRIDRFLLIKYKIHKWAFIVGIISLFISRVMVSLINIF